MAVAIRKHFRDFIAITLLMAVALAAGYVIVQNQRLRIPVLEERPFELKAEFSTAQATVPGQGQTLRVAGVKVGDVEKVELEDGVAVVTFGVDRDYLPVYKDATMLLRPQTGLQDVFFEMDPGTEGAGEIEEGGTGHAREHRSAGQPGRAADRARRRHAGLPAASARRRRSGPGGPRQGPRQGPRLARADHQRPRRDQPQGRRAREQPALADHQLQPAEQGGRQQRAGAHRPRHVV